MMNWLAWIKREEIEDMINKNKDFRTHPAWKIFFSQVKEEEIKPVMEFITPILDDEEKLIEYVDIVNPEIVKILETPKGRKWLRRQLKEFREELERRGWIA